MTPDPLEAGAEHEQDSAEPLQVPPTYVPTKTAQVLELDMGDGMILYNHDADLVHHLNPSAAIVWQLCDGQATIRELAVDIAEAYGQDAEKLREQLLALVAEFDALGLVADSRFRILG